MKNFLFGLLLWSAGTLFVSADPATIYINNSPLTTPPRVDATIFLNRSFINIFTSLPFQAQNVQYWTNTAVMQGSPGFRFEFDRDGKPGKPRRGVRADSRNLDGPSQVFFNSGNVAGSSVLSI